MPPLELPPEVPAPRQAFPPPRVPGPWETSRAAAPAGFLAGTPAPGAQPHAAAAPWYAPGPLAPQPGHQPWPGTGGIPAAASRIPAPLRAAAIVASLVLGLGLLGGAAAGSWLTGDTEDQPTADTDFQAARDVWHSVPVDELFPRTLSGKGAGPGGANRTWTRIGVAPDSTCKNAFDPLLAKALSPAGCKRLLRATYVDATTSSVTTVGLVVTRTDEDGMRALRRRFSTEGLDERSDLMPKPYAAKGTPAAGFGDAQRASWVVHVLTDAPAVVYAVSGFADGRTVQGPQPAEKATAAGATSDPAQAGMGHDARGVADRIERGFRRSATAATEDSE
ncbi:hypothetical protein ABZW18_14330 [Streptomyces sp. NPDC004647]|uniref:hypothetical protein n=1 Tax=Streptomyces sp. NPDC004647 TaxID=3154671 RepID=UPI0033BF108E